MNLSGIDRFCPLVGYLLKEVLHGLQNVVVSMSTQVYPLVLKLHQRGLLLFNYKFLKLQVWNTLVSIVATLTYIMGRRIG
jgi:hypothetical protein